MYGARVHEAVFQAKETESGATVHEVNSVYDAGRIVAMEKVNIQSCSSVDEIASKVLDIEHRIYAKAILQYLGIKVL